MFCLSCGKGQGFMPTSGGRAYEVLVMGSDTAAVATVAEALRNLTMMALPQQESTFDVSAIVSDGLSQATRYARNIVMVTVGGDSLKVPRVTYAHNTYARPQLLLHLRAASNEQLEAYIKYNVRALERHLVLQELNNGIARLRERHNNRVETLAKSMFRVRLWAPDDLTKWKVGKDFLWISNDATQGMQSLCLYRYKGHLGSEAEAIAKRDSFMKANIPGEDEGTYMTTAAASVWAQRVDKNKTEMRGLWEMHGDAMGGPFVSLSQQSGDSVIVAEAFVYAPEMKKRNIIRRLEASLRTIKIE